MAGFLKFGLFWGYWFPVAAYCAAIFIQSAYPSPDSMSSFPLGDKMLHFLAYALMAVLFFRALEKTRPSWRALLVGLLSVAFTVLYGVSDEFHQSFVDARMADGADILADFAGGVFGASCFLLWRVFYRMPEDRGRN
jgi:VanZ family protein